MAKILRVINPFFIVELGDIFEYDEKDKTYKTEHKEEFYDSDNIPTSKIRSAYNSEFVISTDYAESLIKEGYLEEVNDQPTINTFVNVFDEINTLLGRYKKGLETLKDDTEGLPLCLKAERESVLTNLVTLLEHLKSLKK